MDHYLNDFNTTAHLNSLGYRGIDFLEEKPSGVNRILAIGDSITFGHGVSDKETFPFILDTVLKKTDPNTEVINGGFVGAFSADSYYVYLKERGLQLKPDTIILEFFALNDIDDFSETVWDKVDTSGLPTQINSSFKKVDGKILRTRGTSFKYRVPLLRESQLFILLATDLENRFPFLHEKEGLLPKGDRLIHCTLNPDCIHNFQNEEEKFYTMLNAIKQLTDKNGIRLLVILFPGDVQLYPWANNKYRLGSEPYLPPANDSEFLQKRVTERLHKNGFEVFDLFPFFDQQRDFGYPYFPNDGHFNALGNEIIGYTLASYLKEKKYIN